jgi:single-stranded DNA-binding protein
VPEAAESAFKKWHTEGIGEVAREVRTRSFSDGSRFVSSINSVFYDDEGRRTYINVVCWDDLSDKVSEWGVGTRFAVKGRIVRGRDWTGNDGVKRRGEYEFYANEIAKLGARKGNGPEKVKF